MLTYRAVAVRVLLQPCCRIGCWQTWYADMTKYLWFLQERVWLYHLPILSVPDPKTRPEALAFGQIIVPPILIDFLQGLYCLRRSLCDV